MPFPPRRTAVPATLAALILAGVGAGTAAANPYPIGPSTPIQGSGATVAALGDGVFRTDVWARNPVLAGYKFQAGFGCSRAGTHLESVSFQAVRNSQLNSSIELRVLSNGARVWGVADSDIPIGANAKQYGIGLAPTCSAHVELNQVEARDTPTRTYYIGGLTAMERDVTAPDLGIRSVTAGWITGNSARVNWGTYDNYDARGIENQRVSIAGSLRWQGYPEAGEHGVDVALDNIPDGQQPVTVEVDGKGTGGASQTAYLYVDRVAPAVTLKITRLGPWKVRIAPVATDATSGVGVWSVKVGDTVIASHANNVADIDLRDIQPAGGAFTATIQARDIAGNWSDVVASNSVNISPQLPKAVAAPAVSGKAIRGEVLTATAGRWSDPASSAAVTTHLQWQRCSVAGTSCSDIPNATALTYTLGENDLGRSVRVAVTADGVEGSTTAHSATTAPVIEPRPAAGGPGAAVPNPGTSSPRPAEATAPQRDGVRGRGLKVADARDVKRGRKVVSLVRISAGDKVTVSTSYERNGAPVENLFVRLVGPKGGVAAHGSTDPAGNVTLAGRVNRGGTWRLVVDGAPAAEQAFVVQVRAKIAGVRARYAVPAFGELSVPGSVVPARYSGRKLVQLQVLLRGRWTSRAQTTTDAKGRFVMRYQFVLGGGYTVPMRIVAPAEKGWPFAPAQSRPFEVVVRP